VAKKSKSEPAIEDAEVIDDALHHEAEVAAEIETIADSAADSMVEEAAPESELHELAPNTHEEDVGVSLSTRVLRGLLFIFAGIALALWGAPKIVPFLPAGLAPVAEFLAPAQPKIIAEIAALRMDLEDQIATLAPVNDDAAIQQAIDAAIVAYDKTRSAELAALKDQLAATDGADIAARLATLETQNQGVNAELSAVSERLSRQITEDGVALSEEAATKLSGYQAVLEGLKAQVAALAAKNGALIQRINEVEKISARRIEEAQQQATTKVADTAAKKLLTDISAALDSGSPFQSALSGLIEVTKIEAPTALSVIAETGTPSWTSLRNSFSEAAHSALRADVTANAGNGVLGKFGAFIKTQVGTRSLERKDGPETDAILSRIEDDLINRRLTAALSEAEMLPTEPKDAMAEWIASLSALALAQSALVALNASFGAT
jgi:hypothetical protein